MNVHDWKSLPQPSKDAWQLWNQIQSSIRNECDRMLISNVAESALAPLEPGDVLRYAQPSFERIMLTFQCGFGSGHFLMNLAFDPDLFSVRYAIDRYERCDELLIAHRNGESVLLAANGQWLTVDLAARYIVRTLTVGFLGLSPDEVFPLSDAPYAS